MLLGGFDDAVGEETDFAVSFKGKGAGASGVFVAAGDGEEGKMAEAECVS